MKPLFWRVGAVAASVALTCLLFACSQAPTQEEMASKAQEINASDLRKQILSNSAKAEQDWEGQLVKYTGVFDRVSNDEAEMHQETYNGLPLNAIYVELSQDELASLERGKTYTVVGKTDIFDSGFRIREAFLVE